MRSLVRLLAGVRRRSGRTTSAEKWHRKVREENPADFEWIDSVIGEFRLQGGLEHKFQAYKLFQLQELLKRDRPVRLLELGTGTTSILLARYVALNTGSTLTMVDESEHWLELTRQKVDEVAPGDRLEFRHARRVCIPDDPPVFRYDLSFEGRRYDFVLVDGPSMRVAGVRFKCGICDNVAELVAHFPPRTILVDIRRATFEFLASRYASLYAAFPSDVYEENFYDNYRYFSILSRRG